LPLFALRCWLLEKTRTANRERRAATCDSPLHTACVFVRLRPCERQQTLWSEKTTVCRIFNCKRAPYSEALSIQLFAVCCWRPLARQLHSKLVGILAVRFVAASVPADLRSEARLRASGASSRQPSLCLSAGLPSRSSLPPGFVF
jgi:hypothetical protein